MAEPYKHIYKVDLNQQLVRRDVGLLATFDSKANRFGAQLYRDGAELPASGYTVTGYFIRPDDETVNCPGTVEGNLVYVDLLPGCYLYDGAFEFTLKIKQGDEEKAVLMCYGNVVRSRTDATASGGGVVVTVTNAEKLGGKPPEAYTAVQLLDNPDFSIAQAGYGRKHGSTIYAADRWVAYTDEIVAPTTTEGIKVSGSQWNAGMQQVVKNPEKYVGKTLTAAVKMKSSVGSWWMSLNAYGKGGTLISQNAQAYQCSAKTICVITLSVPVNTSRITIALDNSNAGLGAVEIEWAVLYEGTYTAATLPPFVPPDPVVELLKCQKYLVGSTKDQAVCNVTDNGFVCINIPTPAKMHTNTNGLSLFVNPEGNCQIYINYEWLDLDIAPFAVYANDTFVSLQAYKSGWPNLAIDANKSYLVKQLPFVCADL